MRPSFIISGLSAIVAVFATIIYLLNYKNLTIESTIKILLLISIAVGIHSMTHHYEEIYHKWNPITGDLLPQE